MMPNLIAVLVTAATPVSGIWVPKDWTVLQIAVVLVWALLMRLSVVTTDDAERVLGVAVLDSLDRARITVKEAAALMQWDEANFRAALRGDRRHHVSLTRLIKLPWVFWLWFLPDLTYLVARQHVKEIGESLSLRKSA